MRVAGLAAGALALAGPAMAEPWGLTGTPTACAALESLVIFGLVDGGLGGDTHEFSAIVAGANGQRCLAWLDNYGFGDGMRLPACREAFDTLNAQGLPRGFGRSDAEVVGILLSAQFESDCADLAFEFRTEDADD
jgi:hypothetical protein